MKFITILLYLSLFSLIFSLSGINDPKAKRPTHISEELFCVGCVAFAVETVKILKGKKGESDIFQAIANVCKGEYSTYYFTPKEVSDACFIFMDLYDDYNLEQFFAKRESDENINRKLCYEKTKVCDGINMKRIREFIKNRNSNQQTGYIKPEM